MSIKKVFIHTNNKQLLGAKLAKYAIKRNTNDESIKIDILNVDERNDFKEFVGKSYKRSGKKYYHVENDLQSFTLSRFLPPELMNYEGMSVVIDPDIFALRNMSELFNFEMDGKAVAACRKKDNWDSSVMLMNNSMLKHWSMSEILSGLSNSKLDYNDVMTLKFEDNVHELSRSWNDLDNLNEETSMLHTTNRLTQPWKTGLKIDFTRLPMKKYFGLIPREPIHFILGKRPSRYQQHPNKNIQNFFFELLKDALNENYISYEFLKEEILNKNLRKDIFKVMNEKNNV